ncbi:hypothetical protein ILUMI_22161 [Ignelater luminosus]|uniref:Protein-lysine N-methyltransferase SMYD4 n=1 Tax=Ignelater luminosus TaxID=2038154 RepID=A0A8K0CGD8_IGNLU|nr:hypothetical protein ILUMI_22161 [Ignelater luminosus]
MSTISNFFIENCKNVISKLPSEEYENFKNTTDDYNRIKILYPFTNGMTIEPVNYGKNYNEALQAKNDGNSYFAKREVYKALDCYTKGIIKCPRTSDDDNKLLAVLIANRSACLYDMQDYRKALNDVIYTESTGNYPLELQHKLSLRKAKCYNNIPAEKHLAVEAYERTISYLDQSKLEQSAIQTKKKEINATLNKLKLDNIQPPTKSKQTESSTKAKISEAIMFDEQENLGRFARSTRFIECGTTIIDEPAHCAVVAETFALTNCQYCLLATNTPVACKSCAYVVYCSLECLRAASKFHRFECGLHSALFSSGASINCYMAMRIVTQHTAQFFENIFNQLADSDPSFIDDASKEYLKVYKLCRNEELRKKEEYFHYTLMAIFLVRLLKNSSYFNPTSEDTLSHRETLMGSLILRHLQALQFNAHEVSELQEAPPGPLDPQDVPNFKAVYIGGGLYPTLALFNHSCDPSIVRYNIGSRIIVKTIKPIKQGEIVYENYGPIYTNIVREERETFLWQRYLFKCNCQACVENWPLFKDMVDTEVKIPCNNKKCNGYFYLQDSLAEPIINCKLCKTNTSLFPHLKALTELENILPIAEELYKEKKHSEATKLYLKALKIYFNNTIPPFPDWVKVQQRLRTCIVSNGNKSIEYIKIRGNQ